MSISKMASLFIFCAAGLIMKTACATQLIKDQVSVYRTILESLGKTELDAEGIVELMALFDGSPKYNNAAAQFISKKIMGGEHSLSFDGLEGLLEKIYGDQISDDPFEPQEIHLALGQDQSTMKVMWVTMQQALEEPFVEYMAAGESDWAQSATVVSARNYTYEVPQKWWPVFEGMIYEADMAALQPGAEYQYRVGGYDSVNATTRRSAVFPFRAAPAAGDPDRDTRIAALADHGTFELLGFATVDKMVAVLDEQPDAFEMVFVAGDLSYAGLSTDMPRLNISKEDEVRFLLLAHFWREHSRPFFFRFHFYEISPFHNSLTRLSITNIFRPFLLVFAGVAVHYWAFFYSVIISRIPPSV